ncbi:MAG: PilZ domain-containing protein [Parasphingopyxis sp.]|uniref:PilZ domain-containing protein n=1 Tax=Parasphingopyxis sp. TaxID=1920299 RepID=UPI00260C5AAF|nr:PilZ domain-containing protein [uncultured Parasphingopyxis sp.]
MQTAKNHEAERREYERHVISLAAKARRANGGTHAAITILDVSEGGVQTLGAEQFGVGTDLLIYLPGIAPKKARVVWQRDGRTGSQFDTPLHIAVVDHLARQFA